MSDSLYPMECSPPGSSAHGSCAGKNAGVACPCLQGDPTMKERITRKPIWADKEVREPRDQRLRTSWLNAIWDSCVLISFYVKVKMLRATKPVPWEGRGELRRAESARKPSRFPLTPLRAPAFCCGSKGVCMFTLRTPSVILLPDSL